MAQFTRSNPMDSMRSLLRLQSPTNVGAASGNPFMARRQSEIASGADEMLPDGDSPGLMIEQENIAKGTGMGVSRDALRGDVLTQLKQKLGLMDREAAHELDQAVIPEQVRGEYGVRAAEASGRAAADRLRYTQEQISGRQEQNQGEIMARLDKTLGAQGARQEDAQAFKRGQTNPGALTAIARERQALAAAVAKSEPGALGKLFQRTNPRSAELESFDGALGAAQQIVSQFPDASAEDGLAQLGENQLTPEEIGQVQKFLLLLRGH